MRHRPSVVFVAVLVVACTKADSMETLRTDGFSCRLAGQRGGFGIKPGEHCFVCPDQEAMLKCSKNPVSAGCKEDQNACPKVEK